MNCKDIRPLISAYHDGEATPQERAQVEYHLGRCEACRQDLAAYRAIGQEMRALPLPVPPVELRRDVWRAIEAQQSGTRVFGGAPTRSKVAALPERTRQPAQQPKLVNIFTGIGGGWARALPAVLVVAGLTLAMAVLLLRGTLTPDIAGLETQSPILDYGQPVHVKFHKQVVRADVEQYTYVRRLEAGVPYTVTVTTAYRSTDSATGELTLQPQPAWEPGASYEVYVDAPRIRIGIQDQRLGAEPLKFYFSAAAHTPTPSNTPTDTPVPTDTPIPATNTPEPPPVAQGPNEPAPTNTPAAPTQGVPGNTPLPKPTHTREANTPTVSRPADTPTRAPLPTNTAAPTDVPHPTNTTEPVRTAQLSHTPAPNLTPTVRGVPTTATAAPPSATPTRRATATATSTLRPKATATPRVTPPPTSGCDLLPVRGFGKVWQSNPGVRERVGCPVEAEAAISAAAHQRFEGGYMFWRGDTRTIYVFASGSPNDRYGIWHQFTDTWSENDPTPQPQGPGGTPPPGLYEPVRGFGKIWRNNDSIRLALGWAIEPERNVGAAWQPFQRGTAIWTADRVIRFLYQDDLYERFEDTFTPSVIE